jgi:vitamin B12 transporter
MKTLDLTKKIISTSVALSLTTVSLSALSDEVVVVTANRMEQNINDTLADVEVIDRADIERIQPQSFIDLLVNIAGIDTIQRGGQGQDASIFMRGANSNQLLILVDGIRVGSATLGVKSISNISVAQIERVEIVKGPRAALWGSDAIGGVIQIFTRRYGNGEHRVAVALGANNTKDLEASVGFGNQELSNTLTVSKKKTDGQDAKIDDSPDKDGYQIESFALRGNYQFNQTSSLDWLGQLDQGEIDFDTSWGGNVTEFKNQIWNIRCTHEENDWNNQLAVRSSRDSRDTTGDVFETRREQYSYLTRYNVTSSISFGGGIELISDNVEKSSTGYSETERDTKSYHTNVNYVGKALLADFAVRYDDVENVATKTTYNFGFGYRLNAQNLVSFNLGQGYKAPTFNDLYYPWGGNPELEFETSDNIEVVYKGTYDIGNLVASIFDSEVDNLIQWIPDTDGIWAPQNVGKANISGIDLHFKLKSEYLNHKFNASHVNSEDAATGEQLIRRAKLHLGYEVSKSLDSFDWFVQLQYVGKRPDNDYQTFMPVNLDSYVRANIGLGYNLNTSWKFNLRISDAFDEAPTLVSGYHPAGREFYLSISYQNF